MAYCISKSNSGIERCKQLSRRLVMSGVVVGGTRNLRPKGERWTSYIVQSLRDNTKLNNINSKKIFQRDNIMKRQYKSPLLVVLKKLQRA